MAKRGTYPVEIAGVHRDLTLFEVKPGLAHRHPKYPGGYRIGTSLCRRPGKEVGDDKL